MAEKYLTKDEVIRQIDEITQDRPKANIDIKERLKRLSEGVNETGYTNTNQKRSAKPGI